jgi:hypothetical protein
MSSVLATVPMVVVMIMVVIFVMPVPTIAIVIIVMVMPVARDVFVVIPIVAHEVDRSPASVVFRTVLAPVLLVTRRHMQVDRLYRNVLRRPHNYDRLRVDDRRPRNVANVNLSVKAGLAYCDRDTYIAGKRRHCTGT